MKNILFFFLLCFIRLHAHKFEISIATMFRDEAPFLKEWIEFHRLIGVEHFYLYNDNSQDNFKEVLDPYIKAGIVELFNCSSIINKKSEYREKQRDIFLEAAIRAKGESKWVAFIDTDEFIFPVKDKTLPKFLSNYEEYGAVGINWQIFGTSHVKKLDENRLMIEQLVFRAEKKYMPNQWVKLIVQPDFVDPSIPIKNIHIFHFIDGRSTVNAKKQPIKSSHDARLHVGKIRIHHYRIRDEDFLYNVKLKRPNADPKKTRQIWGDVEASNKIEDKSILIYADALKKAVFGKKSNLK